LHPCERALKPETEGTFEMSDFLLGIHAVTTILPLIGACIALGRGRLAGFILSALAFGIGIFVMPIAGILLALVAIVVACTGKSTGEKEEEVRRHAEIVAAMTGQPAPPTDLFKRATAKIVTGDR
jgi:uncharacterized oligopeptide transporter (OPT) family protein